MRATLRTWTEVFVTQEGQLTLTSVRQRHAKPLLCRRHRSHPGDPHTMACRCSLKWTALAGRDGKEQFIVLSPCQGKGCGITPDGQRILTASR